MAYKRMSHNDAYMNVANVEDDEDVIDLLELARAILKHILLIYNRVVDKMKVVYPFYESVIIKKPKKVNV